MRYDTVIVGAGSAGAILAARLSEDPGRSVCLVEAGPDYASVDLLPAAVRSHGLGTRTYGGAPLESHEWQYTARATALQPEMAVPRGRVIGGSSSINGLVLLRALRNDLDGWAAGGNTNWGFDECLPYFRRLESDHDFDDEVHGTAGPIPVCRAAQQNWLPLSQAFHAACIDLGYADCPDMNLPDARGVGPIPVNYWADTRYSTAVGYLIPCRPRPNLCVMAQTQVRAIHFDGRRARAVQVMSNDQPADIEADEFILSAGAIGSPRLLLLSGVGSADRLSALGIQPVVDLPGVGQHMRDHPYVPTLWRSTAPPTDPMPPPGLPWQLQLRATAPGSARQDDAWITMITRAGEVHGGPAFAICASLMYARSSGELSLASADPLAPPVLDFRYFSDQSDLVRLREIARLAIDIGRHPAFDGLRSGLLQPTSDVLASDTELADWMARTVTTGHHVSCTCRMGPASDATAVVDQAGKVHGLDNLRVIDASIMPDCPSVNLNATVMMMAEKLATVLQR
jgi:choline dehydrogenase